MNVIDKGPDKAGSKSATLIVDNKQITMPVRSGTIGPDARRRITIRWRRSPGSAAAGTGRRS